MDNVHVLLDRLLRSRVKRPAPRHVQELTAEALNLVHIVNDRWLAVLCRFEKNRTGSVTENDAGRTIFVVDHRRIHVRTNYQNLLVRAALDQFGAGCEREDKAGASRRKIE